MQKWRLDTYFDELADAVKLGFFRGDDDEPTGFVEMDAASVSQFIQALANGRAQMRDAVAPELEPNARLLAEPNPAWRIPGANQGDEVLLALRHSGYGWLALQLSPQRARDIANELLRQADHATGD